MGAATLVSRAFGPDAARKMGQGERQAFAQSPGFAMQALGLPGLGGNVGSKKQTSPRRSPQSLFGGSPASNARSTGRSLVKDPVGQGSLLA